MLWIAISGSWRTITDEVEQDVRSAVRSILREGNGIVSGGAPGVDYIATDEALQCDPTGTKVLIILPTPLQTFASHLRRRADEGIIPHETVRLLLDQLSEVAHRNPDGLREMDARVCTPETYYARNSAVLAAADELYAFQVNNSQGTQDTIDKARALGLPVTCRTYSAD